MGKLTELDQADPAVIDDDEFSYDDQSEQCPRCSGDGEVPCHCGGDLCICENYGDAPCPLCFGEGVVSAEKYATYFEHQRKNRQSLSASNGEIGMGKLTELTPLRESIKDTIRALPWVALAVILMMALYVVLTLAIHGEWPTWQ